MESTQAVVQRFVKEPTCQVGQFLSRHRKAAGVAAVATTGYLVYQYHADIAEWCYSRGKSVYNWWNGKRE